LFIGQRDAIVLNERIGKCLWESTRSGGKSDCDSARMEVMRLEVFGYGP